jgi:AbiV family abortive infection protein
MAKHKDTPLDTRQLHQGALAALAQSEALLREAVVLFRKRHFAGSYSKAVLALEEFGKHKILFYQAALVVIDRPPRWGHFWKSFYSHQQKLKVALHWASELLGHVTPDVDSVKALLRQIEKDAAELDRRKQNGQYSDFLNGRFERPNERDFKSQCSYLLRLVQVLTGRHRAGYPTTMTFEDFMRVVGVKTRYARAIGTIGVKDEAELFEVIAHRHTRVLTKDGALPRQDEFIARVKERYDIIPPRLPVTLPQLRRSEEFQRFLVALRQECGYPDWVVLGVVFNIVFHHRLVKDFSGSLEQLDLSQLRNWSESAEAAPLDINLFVDRQDFELFLDIWLSAFLVGLGVVVDVPKGSSPVVVRRVAAHHYGIFDRDIDHEAVLSSTDAGHQ